jgi:hypothetical protein
MNTTDAWTKTPGRSDTCKMDLKSEGPVQQTKLACMKSGSQPAALTLLDPRQGHIAFQLESGRFRGVRFEGVRVGLGKLLACLNLPYRLLRFINSA